MRSCCRSLCWALGGWCRNSCDAAVTTYPDATREQQAIDRHVANLLGYGSRIERAAYLDELAKHETAEFIERVKAQFLKAWEKR